MEVALERISSWAIVPASSRSLLDIVPVGLSVATKSDWILGLKRCLHRIGGVGEGVVFASNNKLCFPPTPLNCLVVVM